MLELLGYCAGCERNETQVEKHDGVFVQKLLEYPFVPNEMVSQKLTWRNRSKIQFLVYNSFAPFLHNFLIQGFATLPRAFPQKM
mmetsp:Transcript_36232/g.43633  ORF Transcript_36232/g.43633 Transcript_36232/m.43633 type:complete len:84 (+) Transcript_36232:176-427(+)